MQGSLEYTGAGLRGWLSFQDRVKAATTVVSSELTSVSVNRDTKETLAYPRCLTMVNYRMLRVRAVVLALD